MTDHFLKNGQFVIDNSIQHGHLLIRDGKIVQFMSNINESPLTGSERIFDCEDSIVGPGFIDVHMHGGGGADAMDASISSFETIGALHAQHGTTRFLLTTVTASHESLLNVCQAGREWNDQLLGKSHPHSYDGARPLGIHLEGPYIAAARKGAQNEQHIRSFSRQEMNEYQQASGNWIKWITLAPELLTDDDVIAELISQGMVVSAGHTDADYDQMYKAFSQGVRHMTHLCNAMPGIHHRSPGPIVFALNQEGMSVEFIADAVHVHPAIIEMALKTKQAEEVLIVTDAIAAAGMGDGDFDLGGQKVHVVDEVARLAGGSLAGSCLTMDKALTTLSHEIGLSAPRIFQLLSGNPAQMLGVADRLGSIESGKIADLVVIKEGIVDHVMIEGNWVKKEGDQHGS